MTDFYAILSAETAERTLVFLENVGIHNAYIDETKKGFGNSVVLLAIKNVKTGIAFNLANQLKWLPDTERIEF